MHTHTHKHAQPLVGVILESSIVCTYIGRVLTLLLFFFVDASRAGMYTEFFLGGERTFFTYSYVLACDVEHSCLPGSLDLVRIKRKS